MLGHEMNYPQLSIKNVSNRAPAYGMLGSSHDGWDVMKVYKAAKEAIRRAREGSGPTLLEFKVHRFRPEQDTPFDPVSSFRKRLINEGALTKELDKNIRKEQVNSVKKAMDFAVGSPEPDILDAWKDIFVEES
jgi:pyruvate dehydrogenase E1 component alpha subunit